MNRCKEKETNRTITLADICQELEAEVICGGEKIEEEIKTACGCDLMSDVLAFTQPGSVLLTGLTNLQVVRTAEMLDLKAIIFVRNKRPDESTLELAQTSGIPLLLTPYPLFESCGKLYSLGLAGCSPNGRKTLGLDRDKQLEEPTHMPCGALWWGD